MSRKLILLKKTVLFCGVFFLFNSCSKNDDFLSPESEVQSPDNLVAYVPLSDFSKDIDVINIDVKANANSSGNNTTDLIKNINQPNPAYCHPDVIYFKNALGGYKYWMAFTPYFGSVGSERSSTPYENPTIVASNDGVNWEVPKGLKNPLQFAPSMKESMSDGDKAPKQGFWSDVDLLYENNKFYLYYRASFIKANVLAKIGAKSQNNAVKLYVDAQRVIVRQTSADGIHWTPLEALYNSNVPYSPQNNLLLSPSFVYDSENFISYEVQNNANAKFPGVDGSYVVKRTSKNGLDFTFFNKSKVVNFINKPWIKVNVNYSPWHLQASYVDGYYFLCLAVGDVKKFTSESLYLAFSKDGVNYKVIPKMMVDYNGYRSSVFPMSSDAEHINFGAVVATKNGIFTYREFKLSKQKIEDAFAK